MFKTVSPKPDFKKIEEAILAFWHKRNIFNKSVRQRQERGKPYVFYEGPPTANGKPGIHHVLARAFKDMFPRYKTMSGYYILRRGGWDTHGLPVELEVEKKLGISSKRQIEEYGVAQFNKLCRQSAFEYIKDWERLTERIGFWIDLKTAYITYQNDYIESIWHILKNFWDRGLLYQDFKVVPFCPRCGTPLSDHEVALGYNDETVDPSIFVRFQLKGKPDTFFLVWTTTPWTLPGNVALAVHPSIQYVKVEHTKAPGKKEFLILAEALLEKVFQGEAYTLVDRFSGKDIKGYRYEPLFEFLPLEGKDAHFVVLGEFVNVEDGTGIVHQAPAFGADDLQMAKDYNLPMLMTIDSEGKFIPAVTDYAGMFFKDADQAIIQNLEKRGLLYRVEAYMHTYPFCWRCSTPLMYYARSTWYIRTTQFKDRLMALNQTINWVPEHIRDGRFGNWLENNVDWALARDRYWGTPLPIWMDEDGGIVCVGSVKELSTLAKRDLSKLDLHRPHVDTVTFRNPKTGKLMRRVPELIDVWLDSGAMPYSQWHFPFDNKQTFKGQFPADFICEAVDQTRGWFYSLHAVATLYSNSVAYKNVICLGHILDGEGQKMSKSRGNMVDPWEVINLHGADATRWYMYTATPPGNSRRFSAILVGEVVRGFMLPLWNTYFFFVTYANLDNWKSGSKARKLSLMDRWILSELHALVRNVTVAYEQYDVVGATRPIGKFVDDLSNWYLRRSRRRFWKSGQSADKNAAYTTLHHCLTTVALLLAPAMPFLAEALYQNLVRSVDKQAPESVHLANWPKFNARWINERLNAEMHLTMKLASLGHSARNKAHRKVRQPLEEAAFSVVNVDEQHVVETYADLLADELNVKSVRILGTTNEAVTYSLNPLPKQLGQKYGAKYPAIRQGILELHPEITAKVLLTGQPVKVEIDAEVFDVLPEEVEVRIEAKAGFAVMNEGGHLAVLRTDLTPDLQAEGLAREFVRRVQDLRKNTGFEITDRIFTYYIASPGLTAAVNQFADYIMDETLTVKLVPTQVPADVPMSKDSFDNEDLMIGLVKAKTTISKARSKVPSAKSDSKQRPMITKVSKRSKNTGGR